MSSGGVSDTRDGSKVKFTRDSSVDIAPTVARLFALAGERGWSDKEFGRRSRVTSSALSYYRRGITKPTVANLTRMAAALDVKVPSAVFVPAPPRHCSVGDCRKHLIGGVAGMCAMHTGRVQRTGTTDPGPKSPRPLATRYLRRVGKGKPGECWTWPGATNNRGYGVVGHKGKRIYIHRVSWEIHHDTKIPEGMEVMHSCDNPPCSNPEHLLLGTHQDNMRDAFNKGRIAQPKLSQAQVDEARSLRQQGWTYAALGVHYGVVPSTVSKAVRGVTSMRAAA